MKQYSYTKLSRKTVFVYRSREHKKGMSTDPTETSITIIVTGTGVVNGKSPSAGKH
ncbi:hypothetical protein [Pedobacter agri]|uniref:Uncharacterized protein n=1 Tax=Pedobacter agri TaxID=454586 RepID=A0A9X3DNF0_9SPHI|nr:hypothetical protein [Pedobacter agri]MCX3267483.1 hypothetical protein [Pedobacter agri]MDQ1142822.1 hypothetical protein [Pedobacter agri]